MYDSMVADIICDTFRKLVGTWGGNPPGKTRGKPLKALLVDFVTKCNYDVEDGYRHLELLLYAPANYVGVFCRERWNVRPIIVTGKEAGYGKYEKGVSDWKSLAYHDSCWPDGVQQFLREHDKDIICLHHVDHWYKIIDLNDYESEVDHKDDLQKALANA